MGLVVGRVGVLLLVLLEGVLFLVLLLLLVVGLVLRV